jgi:hypothetical protein
MTKRAFLAWLEGLQAPEEAEVLAWDPDEEEWVPVTGATYGPDDIKLYTDKDEDDDDC